MTDDEMFDDLMELLLPSFLPKSFMEKVSLIDDIDRKYLNSRMTVDKILKMAGQLR